MPGISALLSGPAIGYLEQIAGVAGFVVIAYLILTSVVNLFRSPAPPAPQPVPVAATVSGEMESVTPGIEVAPVAPTSGVKSTVLEIIETIVMTVLIFAAVRLLVQNFRIEGNSMEPNLHDGQYLIIEKVSYALSSPSRGDVIVFHYPNNPKRDFIKRIIGLPGETVEVRQGQLFVNGTLMEEPYKPDEGTYSWGPAIVGPDEYFVLGDNRNNSSDSHSWGMLPRSLIIGRAWLSYWPVANWGFIPHFSFPAATALIPSLPRPATADSRAWETEDARL